jgi:signal transduction histidine kinase
VQLAAYRVERTAKALITNQSRIVQIVCADPDLARSYLRELEKGGELYELLLALSPAEARRNFRAAAPVVTLLDESAVGEGAPLGFAAGLLAESAPLVVVAASRRQSELDALIVSRWIDFVARDGEFVPVAAGLLERRMRRAGRKKEAAEHEEANGSEDFGQILRHEVNNPLTGILGNAELLLARRDQLPAAAVERLKTIADLSVRLRETVRRLSHSWQESGAFAHSARSDLAVRFEAANEPVTRERALPRAGKAR